MNDRYSIKDDSLLIRDYKTSKPFASFLPSVAGVEGVPAYAFYVNRGQGIASFGSRDKDGAIMDFRSANECYRHIEREGFRTFLLIDGKYVEGFCSCNTTFRVDFDSIEIEESNLEHGYKLTVRYFILPQEMQGGLVRQTRIVNSGKAREFSMLDGLTEVNSYGVGFLEKRKMSYLMNAYYRAEETGNKVLLYKKGASTDDTARVSQIFAANYFYSCDGGGTPPLTKFATRR